MASESSKQGAGLHSYTVCPNNYISHVNAHSDAVQIAQLMFKEGGLSAFYGGLGCFSAFRVPVSCLSA